MGLTRRQHEHLVSQKNTLDEVNRALEADVDTKDEKAVASFLPPMKGSPAFMQQAMKEAEKRDPAWADAKAILPCPEDLEASLKQSLAGDDGPEAKTAAQKMNMEVYRAYWLAMKAKNAAPQQNVQVNVTRGGSSSSGPSAASRVVPARVIQSRPLVEPQRSVSSSHEDPPEPASPTPASP